MLHLVQQPTDNNSANANANNDAYNNIDNRQIMITYIFSSNEPKTF